MIIEMTASTDESIDAQILADAAGSDALHRNFYYLCDRIGPRFAGTEGYRLAAEYVRDQFEQFGLERVHLEPFEFLAWRRGEPAALSMTTPFAEPIACYALPYGAGTGPGGLSAGVVDVGGASVDEINAVRDQLAGKFALVNQPARHRMELYDDLVEAGAAAMLFTGRLPNMGLTTGAVGEGKEGAIPGVSIGYEAGLKLKRLLRDVPVECTLVTEHRFDTDTTWNVIGELPGREHPDELVIVGGHLDSHEIGPGAYDNCAGAVVVQEMARLLAGQRAHLKRTVRFINFAAEEIGLLGSTHHAAAHTDEWPNARMMVNCDMPALSAPWRLGYHSFDHGEALTRRLSQDMAIEIEPAIVKHDHSDHYPFTQQGIASMAPVGSRPKSVGPFYGHMAGDTPEKVPTSMLVDAAAFMARVVLRVANDDAWPADWAPPSPTDR